MQLASIKHYLTCANPHDNGCLLSVQMIRKYMTSSENTRHPFMYMFLTLYH